MCHFLDDVGANPGRSGHRMSIQAARIVYAAREAIAALFGAPDPLKVIFGLNITDSLNLALHGLLKPGDHVITSSMEHNAVMRPLNDLQSQGITYTRLACQADGTLEPGLVEKAIQPNTRLVVLNQASNVCGTLLPVREVGQIARHKNLLFLVETAQRTFGNDFIWSVCAAGKFQISLCTAGLLLGGNVRVGMEDNLWLEKGVRAKNSAEQVAKIRRIAHELGIEPATPAEARAILGLRSAPA